MKTRSAPIVVLALAFALSGLACPGPSPEPLDHGGDIPDTSDGISPVAEKCLSCHLGIEDAHPKLALSCTNCHGGDPEATTKEAAHTALPEPSVDLKKLATDQLDVLAETHPSALLFINPGDLRVASRGCGASNPAAGGGGCHQTIVETASRSVMQTFTGHYNMPRFLAGMQERAAVYGVVEVEDPDYDPSIPLSVPSLTPLRTPDPSAPAPLQSPASCNTCSIPTPHRARATNLPTLPATIARCAPPPQSENYPRAVAAEISPSDRETHCRARSHARPAP